MCNPRHDIQAVQACSKEFSASGYCRSCDTVHHLPMGSARNHCRQLIHHLEQYGTIDLSPGGDSDQRLATEYLFGPARGKMFGVLECRDSHGATVILRGFSGMYNGLWLVGGWAPPLFDPKMFQAVSETTEKRIKDLGRQLETTTPHSAEWLDIRATRRTLSRNLMRELHALYRLTNFSGQTASLASVYRGDGGIPTGTGDCCAPKLLHQAASRRLTPVSLAEFYWGKANKSGSRHHGRFYPACREKCQPILGYLLCGANSGHEHT